MLCLDCQKPTTAMRCEDCAKKANYARAKRAPWCMGYLRALPVMKLGVQKDIIKEWYWKYAKEYHWQGYSKDVTGGHLLTREKMQGLIRRLRKGDLILVARFGILCENAEDALEGLPSLLEQGIRVRVVGDDLELELEHLKLIRLMVREWYQPQPDTPRPLGLVSNRIPNLEEIEFMQWCYRKSVVEGLPHHEIAHQSPFHPRTKRKTTHRQVSNAIRLYQLVLSDMWASRELPEWVIEARQHGYFTETLRRLGLARAPKFYRLVKAAKK